MIGSIYHIVVFDNNLNFESRGIFWEGKTARQALRKTSPSFRELLYDEVRASVPLFAAQIFLPHGQARSS
jgi:hypothetical protein